MSGDASMIALTREPSPSLEQGERTHVQRMAIDARRAAEQHRAYCDALRRLGAEVVALPADPASPDSVFIEDTAVVLDEVAVLGAPGAASRRAETGAVEPVLRCYREVQAIEPPGALEGGDVLQVDRTLLVGRSSRTNEAGIAALEQIVDRFGYRVHPVEVRGCLHLKTACTAVDEQTLLVNPDWIDAAALAGFRLLAAPPLEPWGANVLRLGGRLLLSATHRRTAEQLAHLGHEVTPIDISEFEKAEGGVTCLSILLRVVR